MNLIRILKHKEIDEQKWNDCIARSPNSLPYAFSWYLDAVAENWDAAVEGDYKTVMPLVWLRKFGAKCLYQPYYCQQLGMFGENLSAENQLEFLNLISKSFPYININLNSSSSIISEKYHIKSKKNLLIDLSNPYQFLRKNYSESHRRNIQKAERVQLVFSEKVKLNDFQNFYLQNLDRKKESFKATHERIFRRLTKVLVEKQYGTIYAATASNGNLLGSSFIVRHSNRLINIINTSSSEGKKNGAAHFLFDGIIQKFSGTKTVLDFEGSSIPGVARFYEGFGAYEAPFCNYKTTILKQARQRFL